MHSCHQRNPTHLQQWCSEEEVDPMESSSASGPRVREVPHDWRPTQKEARAAGGKNGGHMWYPAETMWDSQQ